MSFPFSTSTTLARLELFGISVPLRADDDGLYSFVFDLSAGSHGGKELAMNEMANVQLLHRRLGHINKKSLELMQRCDGNGVAFDGSIDHCDVCAMGKTHQLAHPKKARLNTPTSWRPFNWFMET